MARAIVRPMNRRDRLAQLAHEHQVSALLHTADELSKEPDTPERTAAAHRVIRQAMFEHALRRMMIGERDAILALLAFARPLPEQVVDDES